MSQSGSLSQPFKFSTKMYDEGTGLCYLGYRFYSPVIGRRMTRDPIGYAGGLNLYRFLANDPLNLVDPSGLYERDVHYDVTYEMALEVGLDPHLARAIAREDDEVDHGLSGPLSFSFIWPLPNYHFLSRTDAGIDLSNSLDRQDLEEFAIALHKYQDSFSHYGYKRPLGHISRWKRPDKYCPDSKRDTMMREQTKWWLDQFKKKIENSQDSPYKYWQW